MKTCLIVTFIFASIFSFSNPALAQDGRIDIVTTIPILSGIVYELVGDNGEVYSLTGWKENIHTYRQKPSDIIKIKNADIFIRFGAGLDSWAASLGSSKVFIASKGVPLLGDNSNHAHPNPHLWLNPLNMITIANSIGEVLIKASPANESLVRRNMSSFASRLKQLDSSIELLMEQVSDKNIITYHPAWAYFAKRYNVKVAATIITHEGAEPSVAKISKLIRLIKKEGIRVLVSEPTASSKFTSLLAMETGVKVIKLAVLPGSTPGTETYIKMMEQNSKTLFQALQR